MTVTLNLASGGAALRYIIKPGFPADIIAVKGNPLGNIDALRTVVFVMKDGLVFKPDGKIKKILPRWPGERLVDSLVKHKMWQRPTICGFQMVGPYG